VLEPFYLFANAICGVGSPQHLVKKLGTSIRQQIHDTRQSAARNDVGTVQHGAETSQINSDFCRIRAIVRLRNTKQ
jgi:hypothetical protein